MQLPIDHIPDSWHSHLNTEFCMDYFSKLLDFLTQEAQEHQIFPPKKDWLNAFKYCPLDQLKIVILGQDPYHDAYQAHGLCFSVPQGIQLPPSLRNIFHELSEDLQRPITQNGNLTYWAQQGVLLLNSVLTVRAHQAASHKNQGWEIFTDHTIKYISEHKCHIVFLLWGSYAQKKAQLIDAQKHYILTSPHPSPLSAHRGFFGNRHFSKTNAYLQANSKIPIAW